MWKIHWTDKANGREAVSEVAPKQLIAALSEFHALKQLKEGYGRDTYTVSRVVGTQTTADRPTPQSYLASELPQRNPDAKAMDLPVALQNKIYPKEKA